MTQTENKMETARTATERCQLRDESRRRRLAQIDVEKLANHSREQRKQLRRFNMIADGQAQQRRLAFWRAKYHAERDLTHALKVQLWWTIAILGVFFLSSLVAGVVR